jgi:hypothetical protein
MTTTTTPFTVKLLADNLADWHSPSATVYLADRFPDLSLGLEPALSIAISSDDGLVLVPEQRAISQPILGDDADVLDMALEAIRYSLCTPIQDFDPSRANELNCRAVTAIEAVKRLRRRITL